MKSAALLALLVTSAATAAPLPPSGITDASLKADTAMLASDAFEGRRPGTPGGDKAVAYITDRFKALGLRPGNHGSWTQDVPLVTITTAPTPLTLTYCRGGTPECRAATRTDLAYGTDVVLWTKRQVATQVLGGSPVVFVGYGITAPEKGWDDYAGLDVHGKTVVFLVNDPDWQTPAAGKDAGPFEGRAMTYYGRYTYKFEEAARHGAAAAIVIHDTEPAGYGWNVITTSWTGPQIDLDNPDKGAGRVGVEGWMTKAAAERMFAAGGQDLAALTKAAQTKGFRAVPLHVSAATTLTNTVSHSASKNVIGIVPGTKYPNETVLITAHWDHLGRCPADKAGDDICNGAVDNASGVAGVLTLAQAFAKGPAPARTMVFMSVTGEESGLLGSRWYAEHPVFPLASTAGGVNMDGLNVGGRTRDITISGGGKSDLDTMAIRGGEGAGPHRLARGQPREGRLFPFRPLQLRQARRADAPGGERARPRRRRHRGGPGGGRRLHRAPLPPAERQLRSQVGLERRGRGPRPLLCRPPRPRRRSYLAAMVRRVRVQGCPRRQRGRAPVTARQPAEWAPHAATWTAWPSDLELWQDDLDPARAEIAAMVRAIAEHERVELLVATDEAAASAREAFHGASVRLRHRPFGDVWLRDTGPLFLSSPAGPAAAAFRFNGWGGKYILPGDDTIAAAVAHDADVPLARHDWVLEGGAIEVDGTGLAVTTEACLLHPNRNPRMDRAEIESHLRRDLGIDRLLWLGDGLANDHTDGHVDNLARFVAPGVLALPVAAGSDDPNAAVFADAHDRARDFGLDVVRVPSPGRIEVDGEPIPASYMNWYVANGLVVVPLYGAPNDDAAVGVIGSLFPGRRTVGLRANAILTGGGSFHCITQQQPA